MEFFLQMGVVAEIIAMNMYIADRHSRRRYALWKILLIILLFTCVMMAFFYMLLRQLPSYGNGNGLFTLAGFLYLLPLHYLYEDSMKHNIFVICFAWTYTLLVFTISVQTGYLLEPYMSRFTATFLIQSLLFSITAFPVLRFMKDTYMILLDCADMHIQTYLYKATYLWFITILCINVAFIFPGIALLQILTFIVIACNLLFSFRLIREVLLNGQVIGNLKTIASIDTLTGLKNRAALYRDYNEIYAKLDRFHVLFLDLDHFKQINDSYGHANGDQYLCTFSGLLREICNKHDAQAYRISGDEFIILSKKESPLDILKKLTSLTFRFGAISFLGVSYGSASYPQDMGNLDKLISIADQRMYESKNRKKAV